MTNAEKSALFIFQRDQLAIAVVIGAVGAYMNQSYVPLLIPLITLVQNLDRKRFITKLSNKTDQLMCQHK